MMNKVVFLRAVEHNDINAVEDGFHEGIDVNFVVNSAFGRLGEWTPLKCAIYAGNTEMVRRLLERNADINFGDFTPLMLASKHGLEVIVRLLLEKGADKLKPNIQDNNKIASDYAYQYGYRRLSNIINNY